MHIVPVADRLQIMVFSTCMTAVCTIPPDLFPDQRSVFPADAYSGGNRPSFSGSNGAGERLVLNFFFYSKGGQDTGGEIIHAEDI
jgi:hypothetical protein